MTDSIDFRRKALSVRKREELTLVEIADRFSGGVARVENLPPSQIVPAPADWGLYLASESSFYRILRNTDQLRHRGKTQAPRQIVKPKGCRTSALDLGYHLSGDPDSRPVLPTLSGHGHLQPQNRGLEIYKKESADYAALLIKTDCWAGGVTAHGLVLHSDNGAPIKGATNAGDPR